ncbi:enoyl-[acyl-carrier-protein] reductase, mitochondrial-like isoform X2 [Leguminivora glycinivorella]|uniref:enoyl-[acyl-carrier-protein] reductase, mitochondrial-like isoform X2 n=1 Tax=Leguminivora glycinivorella TaxID=1035111 RepID=UPI002010A7AA|nr:enoyl-[acyl-carrier-protein] reductase, mitochondrial-like isoform X2 [Leguminivora glycinivorella]
MALLPLGLLLLKSTKCYASRRVPVRNLMSKQLVYSKFGDPLCVVKFRESAIPQLGDLEVLVRMLAAPINPADINTIQGLRPDLPNLPHVAGDEGVGDVMEIGAKVTYVEPGQRVVLSSRQLGTWRYYGIYKEKDVHKIPPNIPLAEASMLTVAPVSAYRLLHDYKQKPLCSGQYIVQNGANSAIGQSVIQICKAMGVYTLNIVANHCGYESVKEHLLSIGATKVYTLEEAEELACCGLSFQRPTLALNCIGGRYEDVMLRLLERCGDMVYYGGAYCLPVNQYMRCDVWFHRFRLSDWDENTTNVEKELTYKYIQELIVMGKFNAPMYEPVMLKYFDYALRNTCRCEAFSTLNYVFDFTLI